MFLQQPGLVVKTPASCGGSTGEAVEQGTWVNADPVKGCLLCNIGESMWFGDIVGVWNHRLMVVVWEIWSNGLYKSALHQVIHRGDNYRYVRSPSSTESGFLFRLMPFSVS
jgi:isopenicillin N synthase-like dioxygenase